MVSQTLDISLIQNQNLERGFGFSKELNDLVDFGMLMGFLANIVLANNAQLRTGHCVSCCGSAKSLNIKT